MRDSLRLLELRSILGFFARSALFLVLDSMSWSEGAAPAGAQGVFQDFEVPDPIRISKAERYVRRHFGSSLNGLRLLELGVAKGGLADRLNREGMRCFGVDINPRTLADIDIVQHDLNKGLPNYQELFDVIFAGEVIEHVFDDIALLRSCWAQLRGGGLFIATVPNLVFSVNRLRMLFGGLPLFSYAPYHYHIYTVEVLRHRLQNVGFSVLHTCSSHILFSSRRNRLGVVFEWLGDIAPALGAHVIMAATRDRTY